MFSENELYEGKELLLQFGGSMMVSCTIEAVMEMDRVWRAGGYIFGVNNSILQQIWVKDRKNSCMWVCVFSNDLLVVSFIEMGNLEEAGGSFGSWILNMVTLRCRFTYSRYTVGHGHMKFRSSLGRKIKTCNLSLAFHWWLHLIELKISL